MPTLRLLFAALCLSLCAQRAQAQDDLHASLDKDDVAAFQKAIAKTKLPSDAQMDSALNYGAFKIAKHIYNTHKTELNPDNLLDGSGLFHSIPCYNNENVAAFEFLALLIKDSKGLTNDAEWYRSAICRFDMADEGYENAKIAILALKARGIDINGEFEENGYDDDNPSKSTFLIEVCSSEYVPQHFPLWLIEQGADPHKKIGTRSAYSVASENLKAAIDKQTKKNTPTPAPNKKEKKPKKGKKSK